MSYRFRILASITSAVLAVSVWGSAIPLRSVSHLFESTLAGFAGPAGERNTAPQPPANVNPLIQTDVDIQLKHGAQFTLYQDSNGETVCRDATLAERRQMGNHDLQSLGMRAINHLDTVGKTREVQPAAAPNLTIILRGTQQLQQTPAASAAFIRAAQNWENLIKSPVTIYIDVDFGTTGFGVKFEPDVLGGTDIASSSHPYPSVRTNLIAEASGEGNATKQAIFNALPSSVVPTDRGAVSSIYVADPNARAIGLLPATAQSQDHASGIAFNSSFTFDFNPNDGITIGTIDFDAVATHEIGHALGFSSEAGTSLVRASTWDLYRFRTGVSTGTFTNAQRLLTIGGSPDPLQFFFVPGNVELGLSTGGSDGATLNGADGWQSSHWKRLDGCSPAYLGIMDPAIPSGCRRVITDNDKLALISFGYNLMNNNPPPPPPPPPAAPANDNFVNAQVVSGCPASANGNNFSATNEPGEPSHDPTDAISLSPIHTVWYQWQAPASGRVTLDTGGSEFDTILAVYTGNVVNGLTRIVFNDDIDPGVVRVSLVTFTATAGTTYRIAIDGWGGEEGGIKLNWSGCVAPSPTPTATPTPTPIPTPTPTPTPTPSPTPICADDLWKLTSTANSPLARQAHTAVWTGTEMIVWGGLTSNLGDSTNTGARYNPVTDTWTDISTINAPPPRANHTAVWTGTEMIVWGGQNSSGFTNTGGRYNPATNTWTPITTANAPEGRFYQQGVWTGSEFIVWGGLGNSGRLDSGGKYNPTSDRWTGISTTNAPSARTNHSSIWTGSELIIWGGTVFTPVNTGGRYNPTTNTWTPVSLTNAPNSRSDHSAVWTGNEMIVWGGGSPGLRLNTGARYRPSTDSWVPMSTSKAPLGRYLHTAVWTGAEMIVWGGNDNNVNLNSGGRYRPDTDSWTATCETNVPVPRGFFSGVWSGSELIIWGGSNLNSGGRYSIPGANPIDQAVFFVRRHYLDFLSREPDQSGWDFWTNQITSCGTNTQCTEVRRVDVSASFFLSIEFQNNGYLVERFHKVAYGDAPGSSTFGGAHQLLVPNVRFSEFLQGTQRIGQGVIVLATGWEQLLEGNKRAYALEFVQTGRFITEFPTSMTAAQFVDQLNQRAGNVLSAGERMTTINLFSGAADSSNTTARAQAVRQVAEDADLYNAEYNRAFVLAEYFGYLRRNPNDAPDSDYTGYDFWLTKLNQFNGNYINAEMVKAFLSSIEYRQRFKP